MSLRRLPIYLLLDCSESMAGEAIDSVRRGVAALTAELRGDPQALETACLSVITFSRTARQDVPLTELLAFNPPKLTVRPGTALGAALRLLGDCIRREVVRTTPTVKGDYRPLVFLLTDGQPTDDWEPAADELRRARPGIANIYAVCCGPDADPEVLRRITDIVLMMPDLSDAAWRRFFLWMSASVSSASVRIGAAPPGEMLLPPPPADLLEKPPAARPPTMRDARPRQVFLHACCAGNRGPYLMRYVWRPYAGRYEAVAGHPLDEPPEAGDAAVLPPVNARELDGVPACPYCGRSSAGLCGCGTLFCLDPSGERPTPCPKCGSAFAPSGNSDFEVRRSQG